jgi:hypothetical protein
MLHYVFNSLNVYENTTSLFVTVQLGWSLFVVYTKN